MSFENHISELTETFYLTTNTPIQAYHYNGYLIDAKGFTSKIDNLVDSHKLYSTALNELKITNKPIELNPRKNVYYTALSICQRSIHRGLFLIGPYSNIKDNEYDIPYKPGNINNHLVSLVRILYKDCTCNLFGEDNNVYGLHVRKAIDFIDARYSDDINLDHLSDYLNINKSYFCTLFKDETNETFTQYLNKKRIEKSKELLLNPDLSIMDIALNVGFNNQNYFNILFKRFTNMTPLQYRKQFSNKITTNKCQVC